VEVSNSNQWFKIPDLILNNVVKQLVVFGSSQLKFLDERLTPLSEVFDMYMS